MAAFNNASNDDRKRHTMRSKTISAMIMGLAMLALPSLAHAQENPGDLTVRIEPGVAFPLTQPQSHRFLPGFDGAVKLDITLQPWLSIGPAVSVMVLPSNISGIDAGTGTFVGGFARVKRPHNYTDNPDTGFAALSPWVEGNASYVRTGPLDRFSPSVEIGASLPTSSARDLWIGPFASYTDIFQPNTMVGYNTADARVLTVGISFEFGASQKKRKEVVVIPPPIPVVVVQKELPKPVVYDPVVVRVEYQQTIQFAFDSPVLDTTAQGALGEVLKNLNASKNFEHLTVEGYASSEGQLKHNNVLALHRAAAVRDWLVSNGLQADKVSAVGFGITHPVASNKTEAGRVANRRAEFIVKFSVVKTATKDGGK